MAEHITQRIEKMETNTIGLAVIAQTIIRYAAYLALAYMALTFVVGWVTAWIEANHG